MDIMNLIGDKTILIMPNEIKIKVLKNNKKLISIKTLTKKELAKKIFFDYDEKTLFYMINKYNLKVDVAVMYLKNMYYIEDEEYDSNKLNELVKMKKDRTILYNFLMDYHKTMPRTMLRYAIEHFSKDEREMFLRS